VLLQRRQWDLLLLGQVLQLLPALQLHLQAQQPLAHFAAAAAAAT
jgi:hypothetical protein